LCREGLAANNLIEETRDQLEHSERRRASELLLLEDGGADDDAVGADVFPGAAGVVDLVGGQTGDGVGHILGLLQRLGDSSDQTLESGLEGVLGLSGEAAAQLFVQDGDEGLTEFIEHVDLSTASEVGGAQVGDLLSQQLLTAQRLDDDVQTGGDGVGLGQEVAVLHQLRHGHIGEGGEHLLVLGVGLEEAARIQQFNQ